MSTVNVQHLPGWDREVHPPEPKVNPVPAIATSTASKLHPYDWTTAPSEATVPISSPPETPRSSVSYAEAWWPSAITAHDSMSVNTKPA